MGDCPPLPIDIDSFPEIYERGCIYVDKTKYIANLIKNYTCVFCARPRRFGKSLTLSTIETLYSERPEDRALFEGLDIAPHLSEFLFRPRPVLRLNMNRIGIEETDPSANASNVHDDAEISLGSKSEILTNFKSHLTRYICRVAKNLNIVPEGVTPWEIFGNLIEDLRIRNNEKIVLLVDEYDYQLVQSLTLPIIQDDIRQTLRNFYSQVKSTKALIFFSFFTGISKFSKVGIFSELNILHDISIDKKYAAMYGYTQEELEKYFGRYIDNVANENKDANVDIRKRILEYYDGYTFDGCTHVYNPISILEFLDSGIFFDHWIQTAVKNLSNNIFSTKNRLEKL